MRAVSVPNGLQIYSNIGGKCATQQVQNIKMGKEKIIEEFVLTEDH